MGSDQQMQRLEETELRKADRPIGVNYYIFPRSQAVPDEILENQDNS